MNLISRVLKIILNQFIHFTDIRFNQIIGIIPQHFDVIVVSIISDYSAVGIYRFAKRLIEPINYIISIFNPWLQSKLSHEQYFSHSIILKKILISTCLYSNCFLCSFR